MSYLSVCPHWLRSILQWDLWRFWSRGEVSFLSFFPFHVSGETGVMYLVQAFSGLCSCHPRWLCFLSVCLIPPPSHEWCGWPLPFKSYLRTLFLTFLDPCDQSFLLSLFRISILPWKCKSLNSVMPLDGCWPSFENLHRENWPRLPRRYFCAFGIQVWSFKTYHSWMFTRHYYYLTRLSVPSDTSCLASNSPTLVMAWLVTQLR